MRHSKQDRGGAGGQIVKVSKDANAVAPSWAEKSHAMFHDAAAIQVKLPDRIPP